MVNAVAAAKQIFVPPGLNLGSRLPESQFKDLKYYYYFLDLLHRRRVCDKTIGPDDYIPLNAVLLRKIMTTKKAQPVIKDLVRWGIIEINNQYIVDKQSKGYRFTEQYRGRRVKGVNLIDKKIIKKLNDRPADEYELTPVGAWLKANYMNQLRVDFEGALAYITQKFTETPRPIIMPFSPFFLPFLGRLRDNKVLKEDSKESVIKYPPYVVTFTHPLDGFGPKMAPKKPEIEQIELFEPFRIVTLAKSERIKAGPEKKDKNGKVIYKRFKFSAFIKPGRNLRWFDYQRANNTDNYLTKTESDYPYIKFIYDIISLQMLASRERRHTIFIRDLIGRRLHTNLTNTSSHLRKFLRHETGEDLVNLDIRNSQPLILATLLIKKYRGQTMPADVRHFIELTAAGNFYEYVMKLCSVPENPAERKLFKVDFFGHVFFCKNQQTAKAPDAQIFKAHFPTVYQEIWDFKVKDYSQLAIQMQKQESYLLLDLVCKSLLKEHGEDFFCLTIHDSIVTVKSNADIVKKRMEDIFRSECGIIPTINPEPFK